MLSAWIQKPMKVTLRSEPTPTPGMGEVLVKVKACGVCGTDVDFGEDLADEPIPLGHEAVGVIEEVGAGVDPGLLGRDVIVQNYVHCNKCENCLNGQWNHCLDMLSYMESDQPYYQAAMADYMLLPQQLVCEYDTSGVSPEAATLAEPLAVALDMVAEADVPLRGDVAVFGPGPIGLMAVRICAMRGARRIFLTVPTNASPRHLKRADIGEKMGATEIIFLDQTDPVERVLSDCPQGLDRVLVTAPPKTVPDAIRMIKYGGIISLIGVTFAGDEVVPVDLQLLHFRKAQLRSSFAVPDIRWPLAMDLLRSKEIDSELLISHVYPLKEVDEALQMAAAKDQPVLKVVVDCQ
jgi:L-iditol 2-dehydrogenase